MKMKWMKTAAIASVMIFVACTQEDVLVSVVEESVTRADATLDKMNVKEPSILDLLETYINKVKFAGKDTPFYTLTPYEYEGDTVMYVANYENGWDLLSTDERTPIVLVSSETGSYNEDELPESVRTYIASMIEEVAVTKKIESKDFKQHEDWKIIHKRNDEAKTRSGIEDYLGEGYWMLVSTTPVSSSTDSIDHLVQTHWHQGTPYNRFTPYYTSGGYTAHCDVGCGAVAVGQLLDYYYMKDYILWSIPMPPLYEYMFESLYNPTTNKYTFTNFGYGMSSFETSGSSRPKIAYFLGYLGDLMNTNYSGSQSSTTNANILNGVNNFMTDIFVMESFNFSKVINILNTGYPILTTVKSNSNGTGGHALLIDKYVNTITTYALLYAWVGTDIYGNPMNTYDEWGNVTSWVYSKTEYQNNSYYKISMNWGEGSSVSYDDLKFSVFDTDWHVGSYHYQYDKKIFHNYY